MNDEAAAHYVSIIDQVGVPKPKKVP